MPQNLDIEISWLIKKGRCFNCKRKRYIMFYYPDKATVSIIKNASDIDDIKNINQRKE